MNRTKLSTIIAGALCVIAGTSTTAQGDPIPKFRPDLGTQYVGTVQKIHPLVQGSYLPQGVQSNYQYHVYDRFYVRASDNVADGWVYVDWWKEDNHTHVMLLRNPHYNNIGKNTMDGWSYNIMRIMGGLSYETGDHVWTDDFWYVESDNPGSIHWEDWLDNNTTKCATSLDSPTRAAYLDANGYLTGFFGITGWNPTPIASGGGFLVPQSITGWASTRNPGSTPDGTSGPGIAPANQYWVQVQATWGAAQSNSIYIPYLFK